MPIQTIIFLAYIAVAALLSLTNWKRAPFLMIVTAALQDPIRKTMPGAPAWMVLSIAPIYAAGVLGLFQSQPGWWRGFHRAEPRVAAGVLAFAVTLVPPLLLDVQYGLVNGAKLILLGLLFYGTGLMNFVYGFHFARDTRIVLRLFRFYVIVTAVMLTGVVLEYRGLFPGWRALGTEAMGHIWIRYIPGRQVRMYAGFYRSPDIMGWHAVTMVLLALTLALNVRRLGARILWSVLAGWGMIGTFLCGRRKFAYMLPFFLLALLYIERRRIARSMPQLVLAAVGCLALFFVLFQSIGYDEDISVYYFRTAGDTVTRAKAHGYSAVLGTFLYSGGFFGKGLGSAATGAHRAGLSGGDKPRTWQEGGLSRLAVELGVPGFACGLILGFLLLARLNTIAALPPGAETVERRVEACLFALVLANGASFIVSGQIFGAPFVGFFFSLLVGMALAASGSAPLPMWRPGARRQPGLRVPGTVPVRADKGG